VVGLASFYGERFEGKQTASGFIFQKDQLVAAHPSYPFGTRVRVTSLENGRSVVVRIVDRGPSSENVHDGVIIDLSERAAELLGFIEDGRQRVRLRVLNWGRPQS
jgi:rare lipoprotein A